MFVTISLIVGIVTAIYYYLTLNFDYWLKKGVPGPKPAILVGNLPNQLLQQKNVTYDLDDIYRKFKNQTSFVGIFNMRKPQILVIDPEIVKDVLIRKFKNFHDSEFAEFTDKETDPIFGRNPFLLTGEEWKEKRAEITPAFTTSRIKALFPLIEDVCGRMIKFTKKEIDKKSPDGIDTRELTAKFTTDVVSSCIYALDANSFTDDKAKIREMGKKLFEPSFVFFFYFAILNVAPIIKYIYKMPFVPKNVEQFFVELMKNAIDYRLKNKIDRDDYMSYLLQLREKKNLSDLDMAAHAITFFIDGFETSSIAMAHILYDLAKNGNAQAKLRQEIKDIIAKDGSINYDNITELPYMDQVFHETLRLHPPATFISKLCTEETKLKLTEGREIDIEKGICAVIPILSIHHDPEHYNEGDKFIPERFDPENGGVKAFREKGVLIPFGDGPRICLGMRFAMAQVKTGVAEIIRNFEISVNRKTQEPFVMDPKSFINLPIGGIWLNFKAL